MTEATATADMDVCNWCGIGYPDPELYHNNKGKNACEQCYHKYVECKKCGDDDWSGLHKMEMVYTIDNSVDNIQSISQMMCGECIRQIISPIKEK